MVEAAGFDRLTCHSENMYMVALGFLAIFAGLVGLHFGAQGVFAHDDIQKKRVGREVHFSLFFGGGIVIALGLGLVFVR